MSPNLLLYVGETESGVVGEEGWDFGVLGPLRVAWRGESIALGTPQARTVFAVLLLTANQVVSRDRIADELWGDRPPASAKVQIQGLISQLRHAVARPLIVTRGPGYLLEAPPGTLDIDQFTRRVASARGLIADGRVVAGTRQLRAALVLWRGPALADVSAPAARAAADQWDELRLAAIEDRVEADLELGRTVPLVAELPELIAAKPFRERLRGQLMTALARAGRVAEALQAYQDWRRQLDDELGVEPSPALRGLYGGILRADAGLRPPSYSTLRRPTAPCQLPTSLPGFTGRHDLVTELTGVLRLVQGREIPPVLAISGAGGIGKTSLAVRLAELTKVDYPDGQLFIRWGATGTEPLPARPALTRLLLTLGAPADMIPADPNQCATLVRDLLTGRRLLLVLDDAAEGRQILSLLPAEPACAVIVTSRQPLIGVPAAIPVPLDVLMADEADDLLATLIGRHRMAVEPEAAATIVALCGGMPLAVQIVGGRLADRPRLALSVAARSLASERDRLGADMADIPVRSSFAAAHRRLAPRQRELFARLGLLSGADFSAWVAAALLDIDVTDARGLLDGLADLHMVQPAGSDRYRLHDLLRSLAVAHADRIPRHVRQQAVTRALGGWLWLAEQAADRLPGSVLQPAPGCAARWPVGDEPPGDALAWFDDESTALCAAVSLAADLAMGEMAWELAVVCASYWDHRGLRDAWFRCHSTALSAARTAGCDRGAAALLRGLGQLHIYRDDFPNALTVLTQSYDISERIGDGHGIARALAGRATVWRVLERYDEAAHSARQALAMFVELGDVHGVIQVRNGLAAICLARGQVDEAQAWLDEALQACVGLDDDHRLANVLRMYAQVHFRRDDTVAAMRCLGRALEMLDAMRDQRCTAIVRLQLGRAHTVLGDHEAARNALLSASVQFVEVGDGKGEVECARLLGDLTASRASHVLHDDRRRGLVGQRLEHVRQAARVADVVAGGVD